MLVTLKEQAAPDQLEQILTLAAAGGLQTHVSQRGSRIVAAVAGGSTTALKEHLVHLPGVDSIVPIHAPYPLASREFHPEDTSFELGSAQVGGSAVTLMGGPCSVESRQQTLEIAQAVRDAGAQALRGGAYKPRTSPYAFQGLGEAGLEILAEAGQLTGLPVVTEVMSVEQMPLVARYANVLQIGARNMQNFALLHAAGESQRPILLKRGLSSTIEELLMAAEYILSHGNRRVMLCERGIRTFETATRNTTDINAVPVLKSLTHLPVFIDPSHSTGHRQYVTAVARAGVAAGADGLIVEVHNHPEEALSDGAQSLLPGQFMELAAQVRAVAQAVGRDLPFTQETPIPIHLPRRLPVTASQQAVWS